MIGGILKHKENVMRIKGVERDQRRRRKQYGMRVDGSSVRRVQADLAHKKKRAK